MTNGINIYAKLILNNLRDFNIYFFIIVDNLFSVNINLIKKTLYL